MDVEISQSDNGLRVATATIPEAQSASVTIYVGTGSRYEEQRINGISHYLEHMLFKGTKQRPRADLIAEAIEGAGGRTNASTGQEVTSYVARVPYDKMGLALEVLADMVNEPLLEDEEVERERNVIYEEIKRSKDSPGAWVWRLLSLAVYGDQPMGWEIAGTQESVGNVSRQDLVQYMGAWYAPNNIVLSVAGRVSHQEVVKRADALFQERRPVPIGGYSPVGPRNDPSAVIVETRPISQANLAMGLRAFNRHDPDRYALTVLTNLLGRGMSSRLFREVRERRGLAYSVGCQATRYHDTGLFTAFAGVDPANVAEAARVIVGELKKLVDEPVATEELVKAQDYTIGNFRLDLEDTMSVARWVGSNLLTLGRVQEVEDVVECYRAVTVADLQRVAGRIFTPKEMSIALTGPNDETEAMTRILEL